MKWAYSFLLLFFFACTEEPKTSGPINSDTNQTTQNSIRKVAANPYVPVDVSPMDIIYFPVEYPLSKSSKPDTLPPKARVIYSRPQKQGRQIFGTLIKWGEAWRLGANEATEIELFGPATIQGKRINPGRYILYCLPQQNNWTIVFNTNTFSWGLQPTTARDVARFTIPVRKAPATIEYFTMAFQETTNGAELIMAWDDSEARLPIQF